MSLGTIPDLTEKVASGWMYNAEGHCGCGSFADVYKGDMSGTPVAIKKIRIFTQPTEEQKKFRKRMDREIRIHFKLTHPNIVKLLGKYTHRSAELAGNTEVYSMVFPWMEGGNLANFLLEGRRHYSLKKRIKILCDISAGLNYLHSWDKPIVHGDLSAGNILFDHEGTAYLSDFGMATIPGYKELYQTTTIPENYRWCAPEYYSGNPPSSPTREGDVYSFASIVLTVFSGNMPYYYVTSGLVKHIIHDQKWPRREKGINDTQWDMMKRCWTKDPNKRPKIEYVAAQIQRWYADPNLQDVEGLFDYFDPDLFETAPYSMLISNLPVHVTLHDLLRFLHRQHILASQPEEQKIVEPTDDIPTTICPNCPTFIFVSGQGGKACAFYKDEPKLCKALQTCTKKKWTSDDRGPTIMSVQWKTRDGCLEHGTGAYLWRSPEQEVLQATDRKDRSSNDIFIPYRPARTFLMRSNTEESLSAALIDNVWRTQVQNEVLLNQAYTTSYNVYLVFCMKGSRELFGIARMEESIQQVEEKDVECKHYFRICWLVGGNQRLPFGKLEKNVRDKIKDSRDGTELPPQSAENILELWKEHRP